MAKKRKKRVWSNVKRLKMQQKKNPMKKSVYKKKLRKARRKDFFKNFAVVLVILCAAFIGLFFAGNYMFEKLTGQTVSECMAEAQEIVANSSVDDFRYADTTYIYSANDTKLAELSEDVDATYLDYEDIPVDVVNAFVAIEDRSFWTNGGVDYKGIARVCLNYIKTRGEVAEGASTITQQLARGAFLTYDKTMSRKIKEIFIARELTKKYTKEEIMEFYCNTCCFANGIYGVEDAAQKYLGKHADEMSLSEAAYICAIPNRPEYYNPLKESQNAITRRNKILDDMEECGYIGANIRDEAKAETITIAEVKDEDKFYNYEVTYAINCAVRYMMKLDGFEFRYTFDSNEDYQSYMELYDEAYSQGKHKLYTGGYDVYTTIDLSAQRALQNVLDQQLTFSQDTKSDGSGIYELQGAMTVIDNETGKVVALIGGRSQEETTKTYSLNRAFQGYAQPGSSFKPLVVYTPALDSGEYDEASPLTNVDVDEAKEEKLTVEEISEMSGGKMSFRTAVEKSENGCAYWLFSKITPKTGLSYINNMNFSKIVPSDYNISASLGGLTYGVSTVEMANAYSTLENHGEYTQTDCIESIVDATGNEVYESPEAKTVYSREAADEMTDIMKGVITDGTARKMNWYKSTETEAAGKTGTTNDYKAGWFCGYTPYYTIAVWVGCDTPKTVNGLQGGTYPAYIWKEAMLYMISGLPEKEFDLVDSYAHTNFEDDDEEPEQVELPTEEILQQIIGEENQVPEPPAPEQQPEQEISGDDGQPTETPETPVAKPEEPTDSGGGDNTVTPLE